MEQLSLAIEWPEKNLPLPPMRSMRSGVLTGFSSVANDDLWNAKRKAAICQCNRLSYHRIKKNYGNFAMAAEIKALFTYNHIYLHTDPEKDVQVLRERFLEWKTEVPVNRTEKY